MIKLLLVTISSGHCFISRGITCNYWSRRVLRASMDSYPQGNSACGQASCLLKTPLEVFKTDMLRYCSTNSCVERVIRYYGVNTWDLYSRSPGGLWLLMQLLCTRNRRHLQWRHSMCLVALSGHHVPGILSNISFSWRWEASPCHSHDRYTIVS